MVDFRWYLNTFNLVSAREKNAILRERVHPLAQAGTQTQHEPTASSVDDSGSTQCGHLHTLRSTILNVHNKRSLG